MDGLERLAARARTMERRTEQSVDGMRGILGVPGTEEDSICPASRIYAYMHRNGNGIPHASEVVWEL